MPRPRTTLRWMGWWLMLPDAIRPMNARRWWRCLREALGEEAAAEGAEGRRWWLKVRAELAREAERTFLEQVRWRRRLPMWVRARQALQVLRQEGAEEALGVADS